MRGSDDLRATEHYPEIYIDKEFFLITKKKRKKRYFTPFSFLFSIFFSFPSFSFLVLSFFFNPHFILWNYSKERRAERRREAYLPNNFAVDGAGYAILKLEIHLGNGVFGEDGSIRDIT